MGLNLSTNNFSFFFLSLSLSLSFLFPFFYYFSFLSSRQASLFFSPIFNRHPFSSSHFYRPNFTCIDIKTLLRPPVARLHHFWQRKQPSTERNKPPPYQFCLFQFNFTFFSPNNPFLYHHSPEKDPRRLKTVSHN